MNPISNACYSDWSVPMKKNYLPGYKHKEWFLYAVVDAATFFITVT